MTDYRMVVRHVRYWRGAVHRWSTVWPFTGSLSSSNYAAVIAQMRAVEQGVNFAGTGAVAGGTYAIALYASASGGVPVSEETYFDYETPSTWEPYTGSLWIEGGDAVDPTAEVALGVKWLAGLSTKGKPVAFRKWFHSVRAGSGTGAGVDISAPEVTNIQQGLQSGIAALSTYGLLLGNASRLAAITPVVNPHYENHQMPKGRKRPLTALQKAILKNAGSGSVSIPIEEAP